MAGLVEHLRSGIKCKEPTTVMTKKSLFPGKKNNSEILKNGGEIRMKPRRVTGDQGLKGKWEEDAVHCIQC